MFENKVCCTDCTYLKTLCCGELSGYNYCCFAPKNLKHEITWFERFFLSKKHPRKINRNNDCTWFEKKND